MTKIERFPPMNHSVKDKERALNVLPLFNRVFVVVIFTPETNVSLDSDSGVMI